MADEDQLRPKRFMRKSEPSDGLPGPSSIPVSPVPMQTAYSMIIALEAS